MTDETRVLVVGEPLAELHARPDGAFAASLSGDALNVAVRLARAGARVALATAVGTDRFSRELRTRLAGEGIDDALVAQDHHGALGLYLVETDPDGERHFTYWRSASPARRLVDLLGEQTLHAAAEDAHVVCTSGITLAILDDRQREALLRVLAAARAVGTRVVFDTNVRPRLWASQSPARHWIRAAAAAASVVRASAQDLAFLGTDASGWADRADEVVVTDGAGATRWWAGSRSGSVAAVPTQETQAAATPAVDTTGAGDAFTAAYVMARHCGMGVPEAVEAGHVAARDAVSHPGGLRWP